MLTTPHKKPEWIFYPIWIIVTLLCVPIAFFIDLLIMRVVINYVGDYIYVNGVRHITEDYLAMYILVPLVGLLTGVFQYALLRRYLLRMGWWVLATTGGWLLGVFLIVLANQLHWKEAATDIHLIFLIMGLSIGVSQWMLLQRRLPQAGWWVAANLAGWGLLALITTGNSIDQYGLFTLGLFPACTTAAVLALLMSLVKSSEPKSV